MLIGGARLLTGRLARTLAPPEAAKRTPYRPAPGNFAFNGINFDGNFCASMKALRFLNGRYQAWQASRAQSRILGEISERPVAEITREDWAESLSDPSAFYTRCFRYFHTLLPEPVREHRRYFNQQRRGFGEDAFHVMWFLLFRELRPANFLEIGVYRGQTLSLAALLGRHFDYECRVQGISPFCPAGDAVSKYREDVDYYADTLNNFSHLAMPVPALLKAYSTDPSARELISSRPWSVVYIDGCHDYEVARQDWELSVKNLSPDGLIVLDDSGLGTAYRPPRFATGGHPGPSRLAQEVKALGFREVLQVGHNRVFQKQPE